MKRGFKRLFRLWCYLLYRRDREVVRIEKRDGCIVCGRSGCCSRFHLEEYGL